MRILILGASGFIGSHLAQFSEKEGHEVVALSRSGKVDGINGKAFRWAFGEPIPKECLVNIDCAIHLAHDFNGKSGADLTCASTLVCVEQIRMAGIPKQIFYSSYSAGSHAVSLYGKTKFTIENALSNAEDVTIIRPGMVIGNGGIYGRIQKCAQTLPVVPLPDGGQKYVPVVELEKLCKETLLNASSKKKSRPINLFEPELKTLKQLVQDAAKEKGRAPFLINVPSQLILALLHVAKIFRIKLPVTGDNLKGFLANQNAQHISTLTESNTNE